MQNTMVYIAYKGGRDYALDTVRGTDPLDSLLRFAKRTGAEWRVCDPDNAGRIVLTRSDTRHIYYVYAPTEGVR